MFSYFDNIILEFHYLCISVVQTRCFLKKLYTRILSHKMHNYVSQSIALCINLIIYYVIRLTIDILQYVLILISAVIL